MWCWPNGRTKTRPHIPPATGFYGPRAPIDTNGDGRPDTASTHTGVDFTGLTTVYAVGPGVVTYVGFNADAGYEVRIRHDGYGFTSRYYHLVRNSFRVRVGQEVDGGTPVGTEGHSGLAKGDHLHLRFDTPAGRHFDPLPTLTELIRTQGAGGGNAGGGGGATPAPIPEPIREDPSMTTAYAAKMPATVPQADVDFLGTLVSSGPLIVRSGVGVYALCGDSPGTHANVQLTQLDALGNAWAADHSGFLEADRDGLALSKGVRWLEWPHFIATLRGYMTPLVAAPGAIEVTLPAGLATTENVEAAVTRIVEAFPRTFTASI